MKPIKIWDFLMHIQMKEYILKKKKEKEAAKGNSQQQKRKAAIRKKPDHNYCRKNATSGRGIKDKT